jgi:cytochrome c-type biogenesis protein CcmH/NrfF
MGELDREILATYVGLYDSKVLVDPRTEPRGWMTFPPWFVLILGTFALGWWLRRWRAAPRTATVSSTTEVLDLPEIEDE